MLHIYIYIYSIFILFLFFCLFSFSLFLSFFRLSHVTIIIPQSFFGKRIFGYRLAARLTRTNRLTFYILEGDSLFTGTVVNHYLIIFYRKKRTQKEKRKRKEKNIIQIFYYTKWIVWEYTCLLKSISLRRTSEKI